MGHKVLISGRLIADEAVELMQAHDMTVIASDPDHQGIDLSQLIGDIEPDAVIIRNGSLNAETIAATPSLKVIAKHGVGVDMIDIDAASARAIPVMITPGSNARSVAEHALGLLLCVLKDIPGLDRRTTDGAWEKGTHRGRELSGKCVGLVGFGAIAQEFAALLAPFGVELMALTRREPEDAGAFKEITFTRDLKSILSSCDIVSLHCPLTEATRGILGAGAFEVMKPGTFIVNTARGELIDEDVLLEALNSGRIAGAGLDCFATEPPTPSNELLSHPRVVATPHIAWATHEASNNMGLITAQNIVGWLTGDQPLSANIVNFENLG